MPFGAIYALSDVSSLVLSVFYRKRVVTTNLRNAFPNATTAEIASIAQGFYRNLTDTFLETIKTLRMSEDELGKRVKFLNADILKPYKESRTSVFIFSSHQCNWEWMAIVANLKLCMPVDVVYKPLKNSRMDELMKEIRTKSGNKLIAKDSAMMQLMRQKDRARVIGILADQLPSHGTNKYWQQFLNQDTAFYMGPEQLPKFTKYPVFFSHIWRTARGHYNVELVPIAKPPYAHGKVDILPRYIEEAEILINKYPSDWLWSHKRWKYPKPEDSNDAVEKS